MHLSENLLEEVVSLTTVEGSEVLGRVSREEICGTEASWAERRPHGVFTRLRPGVHSAEVVSEHHLERVRRSLLPLLLLLLLLLRLHAGFLSSEGVSSFHPVAKQELKGVLRLSLLVERMLLLRLGLRHGSPCVV